MITRLSSSLLACSIAFGSASAAAAPATGVVQDQPSHAPVSVRLRMRLEVIDTTDDAAGENAMNSEDEVYYAIAGLPYMDGANAQMKTVKRQGDRDIWEMGSRSAPTLHRTLFKGKSSPLWANTFMLVIAEQDAGWKGLLNVLLTAGLSAIDAAIDIGNPSSSDQLVAKLHDEFKVIAQRISAEDDEIIGAVAITMKGSKLSVQAHPDLHSKVVNADPKKPVIVLSTGSYKYELTLILEDASTKAPVIHDFIGLEDDDCSGDLWIDTAQGSVQLAKGKRVGFVPKSHEFKWFCDGDEEITRASPATDYVLASRASSGREILWRIFKDYTPTQDLNW